ncbi:hypothetical protein CRG98_001840 [Punica granatum]|uniref:Uncharacterized protein n=1 Tax=Punica granatum TaxID=22663 RepID=A0A2I0LAU3_PUNGR|nr:hypothetical protein CRG98_001840 [Punica granatum]
MGAGGGSPTGELTFGGRSPEGPVLNGQIIATHDDDELLHDSCRLLRSCITSKEYIQASWERLRAVEDVHAALERCHPSPEISSIMDLVLGIHGSLLHVVAPWPKRFVIALKELDPSQVFFVKTPPDLEVANCPSRWYICFSPFTASRSTGVFTKTTYGGSSSLRAATNLSGHGAATWSRLPSIPSSRSMTDGVSREEWHLFRVTCASSTTLRRSQLTWMCFFEAMYEWRRRHESWSSFSSS